MASIILFTPQRSWTLNGTPGVIDKAFFYQTTTLTPIVVYADAALSSVLSQPVLSDGNGVFPEVFTDGTVAVRAIILNSADVEISDIDPVASVQLANSGAASISFAPTGNIAETNAQDAIEAVDQNWRGAKTGEDAGVVSGTAGAVNSLGRWNADGDLVEGPSVSTNTDPTVATTDLADRATIAAIADGRIADRAGLTLTVASNVASIEWTWAGAPAMVEFFLDKVSAATDAATLEMEFSTDAGATWETGASDYVWAINGATFGTTSTTVAQDTSDDAIRVSGQVGNAAGELGASGTIIILNPADGNPTTLVARATAQNSTGAHTGVLIKGTYLGTDPVNGARIRFTAGNITSGTIGFRVIPEAA